MTAEMTKQSRPIWLRTEGTGLFINIVVAVEINGEWVDVIRELRDGEISHIWEDNSAIKAAANR